MKHKGSAFEYERQRDENLLRVYRTLMGTLAVTSQYEIYCKTIASPADRFWVSEERAVAVIASMSSDYNGTLKKMLPQKQRMYTEIYKRTMKLLKANRGMSRAEAVTEVVQSPAPEFYLTPGSVAVILCKIKKKQWYLERKRKLRHLF